MASLHSFPIANPSDSDLIARAAPAAPDLTAGNRRARILSGANMTYDEILKGIGERWDAGERVRKEDLYGEQVFMWSGIVLGVMLLPLVLGLWYSCYAEHI
jgi:hypothetical protein